MDYIEVRFGEDQRLVEPVLRKTGILLEVLPEIPHARASGIWYNGSYFHGIEGARRVAELHKEQR